MAHDLKGQDREEARQRWQRDLPVTLPQLASAQGITYEQARKIAALPGFPKIGRLIWPADFAAWRRARIAPAPPSPPSHPDSTSGKSDAPKSTHGSPTAWPRRAARLRGKAA